MFIRSVFVLSLACSLVIPASADMKSKKKMTMGAGQQGAAPAFESASYVKGARERSEMNMMGFQTISITQCDLKRIVTLNEKNKTYMITPIGGEEPESASEPEAATPKPKSSKPQPKAETPKGPGGVITITTNITDTGETKQMFGYKARHVKMQMTSDASPGSQCGGNMNMQVDGWYIDYSEQQFSCASNPRTIAMSRANSGGNGGGAQCNDKIRFKSTGNANLGKLGYPVYTEMTMAGPKGEAMTMKQETLELSKATLDQSLFEIPAGYREVSNYRDLMGGFTGMMGAAISGARTAASNAQANYAGPVGEASSGVATKAAGKLRIGVIRVGNSAGATVPDTRLRDQLVSELQQLNFDTLALALPANAGKDQVQSAINEYSCDYILYTDVNQAKDSSGAKKAGGFLGKMTGLDSSATSPTYQLGLKFRLFTAKDLDKPLYEGTATASEANLDLSSAAVIEREAMVSAVQVKRDLEIKKRLAKE
jgi:hypothetical protein